ncbi:MAG: tRNA 4-thiouridine(8) synthase ThiI [Firmicutes bacterium]|nr:tRNA 4-thiouridine(8) synthase ThiI [Bacillota bacterium]
MAALILVRYGEIALKGKNRSYFEKALFNNLKSALRNFEARVIRKHGRFFVSGPAAAEDKMIDRLRKVFGVVSVSSVRTTPLEIGAIEKTALEIAADRSSPEHSFKVETRRANKQFPLTSPEINRLIGAAVLKKNPHLKVDLHDPSFRIAIEIGPEAAFIFQDRVAGPGGLPVGVTGRALLLLSGGIDSPVAGWMALKRGLSLEAIHYHSYPYTSLRSREKVIDLCRQLTASGIRLPLHLVSVTEIQREIREHCPPELGIILLRRMMLRLAEELSRNRSLQALVTGESLGQVASQTLESISVISEVTPMLILRPLLGMDKHEIVDRAAQIDTYEISIRPYEDCCTLFVPQRPATRPKLQRVLEAEAALDTAKLVTAALEAAELQIMES